MQLYEKYKTPLFLHSSVYRNNKKNYVLTVLKLEERFNVKCTFNLSRPNRI